MLDPQYLDAIKGFEGYNPNAAFDYKQYSSGYGTKVQPGDEDPTPFSFRTKRVHHHDTQIPCHIAFTTPETHRVIRENVSRSPLVSTIRPSASTKSPSGW